jgi:hypothetical protein
MATIALTAPDRPAADQAVIVRAVTVIMGTVVGLTFTFGFGNVLTLALRLGVPVWVAPLVAPAVDLSILGLLLGTRHLALHGATATELRPARRLLIFASLTTLALNIADPIVTGEPTPLVGDRDLPVGEVEGAEPPAARPAEGGRQPVLPAELLDRARREDAGHRAAHQRPISAETLRKRMAIGAKRSRQLVALVRSEAQT